MVRRESDLQSRIDGIGQWLPHDMRVRVVEVVNVARERERGCWQLCRNNLLGGRFGSFGTSSGVACKSFVILSGVRV